MEYRNYKIEKEPMFMMTVINAIGRGSVHKSLRGYYTTTNDAMKAIDRYEVRKEDSGGETVQRSGSEQVQRRVNHRRKSPNNS